MEEFKLVGTLWGRAHFAFHLHRLGVYFPATNVKFCMPSFFRFLSNPFPTERVPFTPRRFSRADVHTPPHPSTGAAVRKRFGSLPGEVMTEGVVDKAVLTSLSVLSGPPWQLGPVGGREGRRNVSLQGTPARGGFIE